MNNKGLIVLCIMAIVALVGWLAALSGRETIEDLTKEIKFLRSENARLEKAARKEPSTVEAVAALVAKCRRNVTCEECGYKNKAMNIFCNRGRPELPEAFPFAMTQSPDGTIGAAVEAKVKEYMEAQS